jgi:hypothetical protein
MLSGFKATYLLSRAQLGNGTGTVGLRGQRLRCQETTTSFPTSVITRIRQPTGKLQLDVPHCARLKDVVDGVLSSPRTASSTESSRTGWIDVSDLTSVS